MASQVFPFFICKLEVDGEIIFTVAVVGEDIAATVASLSYVMGDSGGHNSRRSWYAQILAWI